MGKREDLTGQKFNRLLVVSEYEIKVNKRKLYNCICDCGKHKVVDGSKLKTSRTKSCGCYKSEIYRGYNKLAEGIAARNIIITSYKHNARVKGINFNISNEKMIELFNSNCYYCGIEPKQILHRKKSNGDYVYNGIDRLSNDKEIGYIDSNVVACCSKCNYIKNKMNYDEFIEWIKVVYDNISKKYTS